MATKTAEQKKEFTMKEVMVLWLKKSKSGRKYLCGSLKEDGTYLIGFINTIKKKPKEPDIRIYQQDDLEECVLSLWCNVSKDGKKKYFTGTYGVTKVVAFINKKATVDGKVPYIKIYESESTDNASQKYGKKVATAKPAEENGFLNVPEDLVEELPF